MAKKMKYLTALSFFAALAFTAGYLLWPGALLLSLAITLGTVCYHLGMRLLVGQLFDCILQNRVDYRKRWFRPHPWEKKLYRLLGVKKWKARLPTYDPGVFDPRLRTWEEIAQATCQAELVHETILLLSFLPILASRWFGAVWAFGITSVLAAGVDLLFVLLQRYNRPRILGLAGRVRPQKQ